MMLMLTGPGRAIGQEPSDDSSGSPASTGLSEEQRSSAPAADGDEAPAKRKRGGRPLLPGSTLPPTNLKKVGDHWTPWDPPDPESFPPDATLHIIVPGDTLWDLADLAFGNPYLWPQIWNENRYILDSHWIYPGDPLLLPARPTVVSEVVPQGPESAPPTAPTAPPGEAPAPPEEPLTAEAPPEEEPAYPVASPDQLPQARVAPHAARAVSGPPPVADDTDIRCTGYIAQREEKPEAFIADQEDEAKLGLTEGDIVYINRGRRNGGIEPGTEYSIVVREGEVQHPIHHRRMGVYYNRLGTVKILAALQKISIAKITMACDEIRTGYDLVPLKVTQVPAHAEPHFNRLDVQANGKANGYVVHVKDNTQRVGTGHIVEIDLGYDDGLAPGDYLSVFIPYVPFDKYRAVHYEYTWENENYVSPELRKDTKNTYPPKIIGQMVVLTTEKYTASAKITYSVREIEVGAQVELY
jgi:hypothetical protein